MLGEVKRLAKRAGHFYQQGGVSGLLNRALVWLQVKANINLNAFYRRSKTSDGRYPAATFTYAALIHRTEPTTADLRAQRNALAAWPERPLISIITPVYNPPGDTFNAALESVLGQTYDRWEWCIADAGSEPAAWHTAEDPRIRGQHLLENLGISGNSNAALSRAKGDFVVFLDHDDVLPPHALYEVAQVLQADPTLDLIYSDEDKLNPRGQRTEPFFKPDWSPDMMLGLNLLTHLVAIRRELVEAVGGFRPTYDGAQDWDLFLRVTERTERIFHIPKVLYHWRKAEGSTALDDSNKPYLRRVQTEAVRHHLERSSLPEPTITFDPDDPVGRFHPRVMWGQHEARRISIIIPSRDHSDVLGPCLRAIVELTDYPDYEIIVVDTGSTEQATHDLYARYTEHISVVPYEGPFNFSRACNTGAQAASGDLLLFLNNDTETHQPDWLHRLAQWFEREGVGVVGPMLLYPDGTVQHAGVVVGLAGLAGHPFAGLEPTVTGLIGPAAWYRNLSAVTGACLLISREALETVGGWDEGYQLNYSDIDLCLQVVQAGYRVVYTPDVRLTHHEGVTHQRRVPRADFERAAVRWRAWLEGGDPYYNPNLTVLSPLPDVQFHADDTSAQRHRYLMSILPEKEIIVMPDDIP